MPHRSHRRTIMLVLLGALIAFTIVPAASAQSTQAQLAFVNGTSTEPVDVSVNGTVVATELAYATATPPALFDAGTADIVWSDGSALSLEVPAATAWTAVSGYGEGDATAAVYPVFVEPIPSGEGRVNVWNATTENVLVSYDGGDPGEYLPGQGLGVTAEAAGSTITIVAGEDVNATIDVTVTEDSYTDVFVVDDGSTLSLASAVVPSMTALLESLGGETPPPSTPTVPDVAGQTVADATASLVEAGYDVGQTEEPSDSVEAGRAIRTEPPAGTELAAGSLVTLFVSSGPATVEVPDVVGQPVDDAVAALEGVGLTSSIVEQESEDVEEGLVIETNPRAGVTVAAGTEILVTVSTGPPDVEVPEFIGLTVAEANAVATEVGLAPVFVEDPDDPDPEGVVVEQDPAAGELVPAGSEVVLQLSPATEDPWTSIKLDPNRFLTAAGINFLPESVSEIEVPESDIELKGRDLVDENGFWSVTIDTSRLDPNRAYDVVVTGTAEDGSPYEQIFTLPPVGETVDEPEEDETVPTWVWFVLGGILLLAIVIGVVLLTRGGSSGSVAAEGEGASTDGDGGAPAAGSDGSATS